MGLSCIRSKENGIYPLLSSSGRYFNKNIIIAETASVFPLPQPTAIHPNNPLISPHFYL